MNYLEHFETFMYNILFNLEKSYDSYVIINTLILYRSTLRLIEVKLLLQGYTDDDHELKSCELQPLLLVSNIILYCIWLSFKVGNTYLFVPLD